jgi:N-acetylmuramic acid 6-phosphate etherase
MAIQAKRAKVKSMQSAGTKTAKAKPAKAEPAKPKPAKAKRTGPPELDRMSALEIASLMNREDAKVLRAVQQALPQIAKAIDVVAGRLERGGRLIYVGSGTSGRIGALEAAESPPTFGTDPETIQAVIAGGEAALARSSEGCEDSADLGVDDIAKRRPGKKDVVVGISASGRTAYTIAALRSARSKGAATIALVSCKGSELARACALAIEAEVGTEVLAGSTRLKAGTAQKMICNMLTTGAMARLGYVYGDQMVHLQMSNAKLFKRGVAMVQRIAGVEREAAMTALEWAGWHVPLALLVLCTDLSRKEAEQRLKRAGGNLRRALEES